MQLQLYLFAHDPNLSFFTRFQAKLAALDIVPAEQIILTCEGSSLQSSDLVSSLTSTELDYNIPLVGGKVHGSLARAGKVRSQTPKVEKQEKKRKKTGRAKRRLQYNRRFNNVDESSGKPKGPNSNVCVKL